MQSIKFVLTDNGDSLAGIQPFYEEVVITFKYGGHDEQSIKTFFYHMEKLIKDCFGEIQPKVRREPNA